MTKPAFPHRKRLRLPGHDYSTPGAYFVTICAHGRKTIFDPGAVRIMIQEWWDKLPAKFPDLDLDEFVVMPNHIHGIVVIKGWDLPMGGHIGPPLPLQNLSAPNVGGDPRVAPLSTIIQWFKTMTTNSYVRSVKEGIWPPFEGKLWQRNYYEHVIRTEKELAGIRNYIHYNPDLWERDRENPRNPDSPAISVQDYLNEIQP